MEPTISVKKRDFNDFEEARISSGLFFERMLSELGISERTYYRWKASGQVPAWALRLVELLSGDLEPHGWRHWRIRDGRLVTEQLNQRYHWWTPGELLAQQLTGMNPRRPVPIGGKIEKTATPQLREFKNNMRSYAPLGRSTPPKY